MTKVKQFRAPDMTARDESLRWPAGWWIIPGAFVGLALWVALLWWAL